MLIFNILKVRNIFLKIMNENILKRIILWIFLVRYGFLYIKKYLLEEKFILKLFQIFRLLIV